MAVNPITPATWSILVGIESPFITGGDANEQDVRNFVLFHLPEYDADRPKSGAWLRFLSRWRLECALLPAKTPRAQRNHVRAHNILAAMSDVRRIVNETFADVPMPGDRDPLATPSLAASLEAQFLHLFASHYVQWPLATPIRHTPIRVLTQLARCIDRADYFDRAEAELDAEYLRALNPVKAETART